MHLKIVFIGQVGVGKTQLINRFLNDGFEEGLEPTQGDEVNDYEYEHDGELVQVWIVDTRGVEELVGLT